MLSKGSDMAIRPVNGFFQHLRRAMLLRAGAGLTDAQLLQEYIDRRDQAAFAAIVQRHGPMVWGVCRRVLTSHHDAEDAFQATLLVLVRRAASIASPELLANWLYGVAHQTAIKARATSARRKGRERQVTEMPEPAVSEPDRWNDLQYALDEELSRLPDIHRVVLVLCDLEGKTRKEAALDLGLAEGTVASRLARARAILAKRLAHRGVALSSSALAAALLHNAASASVPDSVVLSTISAANLFAAGPAATAGALSPKVAALTERVLNAMVMSKLKAIVAVVLVLGFLATGATALSYRGGAAPSDDPENPKTTSSPKAAEASPTPDDQVVERNKDGKAEIAWGKAEDGLQAGVEFQLGGQTMSKLDNLVVKLRNVSTDPIEVTPRHVGLYSAKVYDLKNRRLQGQAAAVIGARKRITIQPEQVLELGSIAIDNHVDDRHRWPGYKPAGMDKDLTFWVNTGEKYRASFSDVVDESPSLSTGWVSFTPHSKTSGVEFGSHEITKPLPASPPVEAVTMTIKDVTLTDVDEDSGTISVSFGNKDNPTKLLNVPLAKEVRVVASHVLPGVANNVPFQWEFARRLRGKVVSIRVIPSDKGVSVNSICSGND